MNCRICQKTLKINDTINRDVVNLQFCSPECLLEHIKKTKTVFPKRCELVENPKNDYPAEHFCLELNKYFRSEFEANVAVYLTRNGIDILYEPYGIKINLYGHERIYIPDFFCTEHALFLEVKGLWTPTSKNKFIEARKLLGDDLILIRLGLYQQFREAVWEESLGSMVK